VTSPEAGGRSGRLTPDQSKGWARTFSSAASQDPEKTKRSSKDSRIFLIDLIEPRSDLLDRQKLVLAGSVLNLISREVPKCCFVFAM
jgi:hypothetical protein